MKLKDGFILREVAGQTVVIPTGEETDLNMVITLNSTGKFLWQQLEKGCELEDLVKALLDEYDVDEVAARSSVEAFVEKVKTNGFFES